MDVLQQFRIIKMRAKMRCNEKYIREIKLFALHEKRPLTDNEYWAIQNCENENQRMQVRMNSGHA